MNIIGIVGVGFVGSAMRESFYTNGATVVCYDKYKTIDPFIELSNTNMIFLSLPTKYNSKNKCYDIEPIHETLQKLKEMKYENPIIIKSTVEPGTLEKLSKQYNIQLIHNPEFLTARTAFQDFHNQKHIVIGRTDNCSDKFINIVSHFYENMYKDAKISICTATESESMKIYLNCFYATKVQFFNELYLHSQELNLNWERIRELMLSNNWIHPMHTNVPGPDGKLSYGGLCFPKDTNALLHNMIKYNTPYSVIEAVIKERNEMRDDNINIQ